PNASRIPKADSMNKEKNMKVIKFITFYKFLITAIQVTYSVSGRIEALKEVAIVPKIAGKVERVLKDLGDEVGKDEILFTLDKTDLYQKLEQLDATLRENLITAESALEQAEIQYNTAKINYENNKALFEAQAISQNVFDQFKDAFELAKVQYQKAQDHYLLLQNKAEKSPIETQKEGVMQSIRDSDVKSPISGVIAQKSVEVGEFITQQQPAYTVVDIDKVVVKTSVTEKMINKIAKGQEVIVTVTSLDGKQFKGLVDALSPAVTGQNVGYPVKIIIDNEKHEIKPGMFAEIKFITDKKENVLLLPIEAVLTHNGDSFVYILEGDKAKKQEVKVGLKDDQNYEIISGVKEGDQVIVKGQHFITDGETVQPVGGAQ
ncbi:MAG: HlyD family secretion protein, partial [Clostridiales bacterium]|nr:HlyD family secretion protein [Clostridiales bacterium]